VQITFDPQVSEWGNPSRSGSGYLIAKSSKRQTRGTETSKYPEEKKIIMIP